VVHGKALALQQGRQSAVPEPLPLAGEVDQRRDTRSSSFPVVFLRIVERANRVNLQARRSLIPCCWITAAAAARLRAGVRSFLITGP
jgi:hypothetical protein